MTFEEVWNSGLHITPLVSKEEGEAIFNSAMELLDGAVIVEIGSYVGRSSHILAQVADFKKTKLICIDPFVVGFDGIIHYDDTREMFKENILDVFSNVKLYDMTSNNAHKYIKEIDYLFIDGDHDYQGILDDCTNYLPKLKSGCCVSFHDHNNSSFPQIEQVVSKHCSGWQVVNNAWSVHTRRKP